MFQMIWLDEQHDSCQTCQNKASKFTNFAQLAQFECNASSVRASSVFPFKNKDGKVKCSLKSGGFVARENLDVINMAIRKQTALKLAAGNKSTAALCFVVEQQSNSREQEECSNCWHR